MSEPPRTYLLIIGDREALAWVLSEGRMAFPPGRASTARQLKVGDRLLIYASRGCFHNPSRDRGRVMGTATVDSQVKDLEDPIVIAGRVFTTGCSLAVEMLAPLHEGLELALLVPKLDVFPDPASWSAHMRRPLLALPASDGRTIERRLKPYLRPREAVVAEYIAAAHPT